MRAEVITAAERFALSLPAEVIDALSDDEIEDVIAGPDGEVLVCRRDAWQSLCRSEDAERMTTILAATAAPLSEEGANARRPRVETMVPYRRGDDWLRLRYTAVLPPIGEASQWNIRRPNPRVLPLEAFAASERAQACIRERAGDRNVVIFGPTSSGKTTLLGSLFHGGGYGGRRMIIIEDQREVRSPHPSLCPAWLTTPWEERPETMGSLITLALRSRAQGLVVGEVRGREALELLQACNAVRPVLATLHAEASHPDGGGEAAVRRLVNLVGTNAGVVGSRDEVLHAIQSWIYIRADGGRRRIEGVYDSDPAAGKTVRVA